TPKEEWAIDQKYTVSFEKNLFADHVLLDDYSIEFKTKPFTAEMVNVHFYQSPVDPKEKRVVATLRFSHPVDSESLRKHTELKMGSEEKGIFKFWKEPAKFTVAFGKFNGEAYINSENIKIPERDSSLTVTVTAGVRGATGGNSTLIALEQ